jgi:hypothetical protein
MVKDELFFGLSSPDGPVTEGAWQSFLREEVTPRFPDGLTCWEAQGQWRNAKGEAVREPSRVLLLVHPAGAKADASLEALAAAYKKRFKQESVMRLRSQTEASF